MKNLVTKRRIGAMFLAASMTCAAGSFVVAPAEAAPAVSAPVSVATVQTAAPIQVSVDPGTHTISLHQSTSAQNVLVVLQANPSGATHNVTVPKGVVGATVLYDASWGLFVGVRYLNPDTQLFESAGAYRLEALVPSAQVMFDNSGGATLSFQCTGSAIIGLTGEGCVFQVIRNGDLSAAPVSLPGGVASFHTLSGFVPGDIVDIRVYGDGSGSGQLLAHGVYPGVTTSPSPSPSATQTTSPSPSPTVTTPPADDTDKEITICHRTESRAEVYGRLHMSVKAFKDEEKGHTGHSQDIVPPFAYTEKGETISFPGNRWDAEGIAIFNNSCSVIPSPSPSATETQTASPSPSASETQTASPSPSVSSTSPATASPSGTPTTSTSPTQAPSQTQTAKVTPSVSESAVASPTTSRYAPALVNTAVKGGSGVSVSALLSVAAVLLALLGGVFLCGGLRRRQH